VQREAGATFVEWQGGLWAHGFSDAIGEHLAVRTDVGIWDVSPLRKWDVRGCGAMELVDHLFTNAVRGAATGQIRYGLFCDHAGAILNDGTVYVFAHDRLWVLTSMDADGDRLASAARSTGVSVEPLTEALAAVQVQGPRSRELLAAVCPAIAQLAYFRFAPNPVLVGDVECWISRIGYSGELGFELFCAQMDAPGLWRSLVARGARPYGFETVETLRVEAGLLLLGADFVSGRTNPYDVSLDTVIKLDKGDFVGREALAATAATPPRRLVTLVLAGEDVPPRGAGVLHGDRLVGTLTSVCRSPTIGRVIGLASVDRAYAVPGGRLCVAVGQGGPDALVARVPIYDPEKRRPRV
jgi:aminomethyltransferase